MKKTLTTLTLLSILAFNSQAVSYNEANWYVTVDVEQIKSKVLPMLTHLPKGKNNVSIANNIPDQVQQITFYGHSEVENDLSAAVTGDFNNYSLNDYINTMMFQVANESPVTLSNITSYNGRDIEQYIISKGDESKSFFSAKINPNLVVVSFEQSEVYNWIDNKYQNNELQKSGLVSLLINIESAMAHMGTDLKSNSKHFNSALFQKITQFSASIYESSADGLTIESALSTADDATAKQLEQILNGLVAMNALSNSTENNQVLTALMNRLQINNHGSELLVSTALPYNLLSEVDID